MKISKIEIANSGPIKVFNEEMKPLTVIYGKNESGKTTIVENIIASLFKGKNKDIRFPGSCLVKMDNQNAQFSLNSSNKLDTFLINDNDTLPKSLFNLLYVKGAEVELVENGIDKTFLKNLLSEQRVYKAIEKQISGYTEIQNNSTKIDNGKIIGHKNTKLFGHYTKVKTQIEKMKELYNEYTNNDFSIRLKKDIERKKEIEEQKNQQEKAKRYRAFFLSDKIKKIEKRKPENNLETIEKILKLYDDYINAKNKLVDTNKNIERVKQEIKQLENDLSEKQQLNIESTKYILDDLQSSISMYFGYESEIKDYNGTNPSNDKKWLEENKTIYFRNKKSNLKVLNVLSISNLILSFVLFILGMLSLSIKFLSKTFGAGALLIFIIHLIFIIVFKLKQKKDINSIDSLHIVEEIKAEFQKRFGEKLISIENFDSQIKKIETLITTWQKLKQQENNINLNFKKLSSKEITKNEWSIKLQELKNHYQSLKNSLEKTSLILSNKQETLINLEKEKINLKDKISNLSKDINRLFTSLAKNDINESEWEKQALIFKAEYQNLKEEKLALEGELQGLSINSEDFISTPTEKEFSQQLLDSLNQEIQDINSNIQENNNKLEDLKQKIAASIGVSVSTLDTETVVEKLMEKQQEYEKEAEKYEAQIIAYLTLKEIIDNLQISEDKQIENYINTGDISDLLYGITSKYKKIQVQDNDIMIVDNKGNEFNLQELSTGAQEQVLLVLRMGISKKLLGENTLFLILDDAFQYSDWGKRKNLIRTVVSFVKDFNWQILYFTMDDNIRNTFEEEAGKKLKANYKLINI